MNRFQTGPTRQAWAFLVLTPLLAAVICCTGCGAPGFAHYVIAGPPKLDAKYTLVHRNTLIVVDDPQMLLGDPSFPAVVGANAGYNLVQNEALPKSMIVPQDRLTTLANSLGDRYRSTPIDQIGKTLDAGQVIYVLVKSVSFQADNTYHEPTAVLEIKVIDVATGKRLFPTTTDATQNTTTTTGHPLTVTMHRQTLDETRRHALSQMASSLAERVGLEVAQVFYKHVPVENKPW